MIDLGETYIIIASPMWFRTHDEFDKTWHDAVRQYFYRLTRLKCIKKTTQFSHGFFVVVNFQAFNKIICHLKILKKHVPLNTYKTKVASGREKKKKRKMNDAWGREWCDISDSGRENDQKSHGCTMYTIWLIFSMWIFFR